MQRTKRQHDVGVYLPSRRTISTACERTQEVWSERVRDQRTVQKTNPVEVIVIPVTKEIAAALGETI